MFRLKNINSNAPWIPLTHLPHFSIYHGSFIIRTIFVATWTIPPSTSPMEYKFFCRKQSKAHAIQSNEICFQLFARRWLPGCRHSYSHNITHFVCFLFCRKVYFRSLPPDSPHKSTAEARVQSKQLARESRKKAHCETYWTFISFHVYYYYFICYLKLCEFCDTFLENNKNRLHHFAMLIHSGSHFKRLTTRLSKTGAGRFRRAGGGGKGHLRGHEMWSDTIILTLASNQPSPQIRSTFLQFLGFDPGESYRRDEGGARQTGGDRGDWISNKFRMKKFFVALVVVALSHFSPKPLNGMPGKKIHRENIEWEITWKQQNGAQCTTSMRIHVPMHTCGNVHALILFVFMIAIKMDPWGGWGKNPSYMRAIICFVKER